MGAQNLPHEIAKMENRLVKNGTVTLRTQSVHFLVDPVRFYCADELETIGRSLVPGAKNVFQSRRKLCDRSGPWWTMQTWRTRAQRPHVVRCARE